MNNVTQNTQHKTYKFNQYFKKFLQIFILILSFSFILNGVEASSDNLKVDGNRILNNNKEIFLRGVAMGSPHFRAVEDKKDNELDYYYLTSEWGVNVVRLSVHPSIFQKDKANAKKYLDNEISLARSKGLFVIVDWHTIGVPNGWHKECENSSGCLYAYDSDLGLAQEFWRYMGYKYSGDTGILFELWNEPKNQNSNLLWSEIKPSMQELYNDIRKTGANNIIIAPGVYWTYDLRGIKDSPLEGENIAYAWHVYNDFGGYLRWSAALNGLNNKYPVIVTEWGYDEKDFINNKIAEEAYMFPFEEFIIDQGLHYTAWCWHDTWKPAMFNPGWKGLTHYGRLVQKFLTNPKEVEDRIIAKNQPDFSKISQKINNFVNNGVDENTIKLGKGEREAVLESFKEAYSHNPNTNEEYNDLIRIANGRWPSAKSVYAEVRAKERFEIVYKRKADMSNPSDNAAVTIMAYGLRQKASNRKLDSEKKGISIFESIFNNIPSSTEEWNILQAITYSGAKK